MSLERFGLTAPRNAFSVRDAARAGDSWRLFQDAAVEGSTRRGWPPVRYATEQVAFVVRAMTVVHHRETAFGEPLEAETWVSTFRRGMLTSRQIRIRGSGGEPVCDATQEWVHVTLPEVRVARASETLMGDFEPVDDRGPDVVLPPMEPGETESAVRTFRFRAWHTWMDPLGHANHPAYLDWSDEATSQALDAVGVDPLLLVPVAEKVKFKQGVVAPDAIEIRTHLLGRCGDAVALTHRIVRVHDDQLCAEAVTVRRLLDGSDGLLRAFEP